MWKIFTGLLSGVAVIALLHMISIQEGHNRLCAIEEGCSIFHVDHRARPLRYNIMSDRGMDRIKSYPITDRSFRGKFATFLRDEIQFPPVVTPGRMTEGLQTYDKRNTKYYRAICLFSLIKSAKGRRISEIDHTRPAL